MAVNIDGLTLNLPHHCNVLGFGICLCFTLASIQREHEIARNHSACGRQKFIGNAWRTRIVFYKPTQLMCTCPTGTFRTVGTTNRFIIPSVSGTASPFHGHSACIQTLRNKIGAVTVSANRTLLSLRALAKPGEIRIIPSVPLCSIGQRRLSVIRFPYKRRVLRVTACVGIAVCAGIIVKRCRNAAVGCWIKVSTYIQLQCCKAILTEIAIYSQMLCLLESFYRCKRMVTKFSICALRIISQACERLLQKRNLCVRSLQIFLKRPRILMNPLKIGAAVWTAARNARVNCIFTSNADMF